MERNSTSFDYRAKRGVLGRHGNRQPEWHGPESAVATQGDVEPGFDNELEPSSRVEPDSTTSSQTRNGGALARNRGRPSVPRVGVGDFDRFVFVGHDTHC